MNDLLEGVIPAEAAPETLSKRAFAAHIGLSAGRISQLIHEGLPVEPNGRIHVERATGWYRRNVDHNRRKGSDPERKPLGARAELDRIRADRARLDLDKARGDLADRSAVEAAIFDRARAERDAWIAWCNRAAPHIAEETDANPAILLALLDRLVRDQLAMLASRPLAEF